MAVASTHVETTIVHIPLDRITSKLPVRRLSASGIARLQESMKWAGFLDNFPLIVIALEDGNYKLVEGNHRYEAAKREGITYVPCIIKTDLSEQECYQLAMQSNNAAEAVIPSTFVTYAEFIWGRLEKDEHGKQKYTQSDVSKMMGTGWGRGAISNYVLLDKIDKRAWEIIATTFETLVASSNGEGVASNATVVAFTENLLRDILPLESEQQLELVRDLASKKMEKGRFTTLAKAYRARNEMKKYALQQIGNLGEPYITQLLKEIDSGAYDNEWQSDKEHREHPKLNKLLKSLHDEWEQRSSTRIIHGDFYEEVQKVEDGCIDLILTDPPYNIARENEFIYEGRSNISQDFGEWDKHNHQDFIDTFSTWAREWARILRDQGSGYIFTSDSYISHLRAALESAGLHVKATIVWHKTNPGTQPVKTNFKSSVEYILFFTKGQGGHTFNWQGENEMHNFIESPICGGNERRKDAKGETLHPTQKPQVILRHFTSISSNRGDTIFDGFMGVGSTGKAAKDLGRKFIGIEQDKAFKEDAERWLAE